ncbi:MAG TPA: mechanosensitive ion channel family protein [Gemmatimonadota bacterium]|nr:mechanosensitive ion channel family protein [Gemmatimonadota bacterium]
MQPEPLAPPADSAAADSAALMGDFTEAVDRITEVRSADDLWILGGEFQVELLAFGAKLFVAAIVLAVFAILFRIVRSALRPVLDRSRLEEDASGLVLAVLRFVLLGFGMIVALDQLGFNVVGILAGLGVAGLALGFAAQDTLANFIAGVTILWDRPFRVGDRVEVDNEFGQVKRITLRSTRIHTNTNKVVIIPNQNVVNNKIVNHTMQASLRLDVPFGIAYKEDIDHTRATVLTLVEGDDRLRERPAPSVVMTGLGESSVDFELRFWLKNPHQEVPLEFEYLEKIKKALDREGIEIPFPHRTLFLERLPEVRVSPPRAERSGEE